MVGRLVSSQLRTKQEQEDRHYAQDLNQTRLRLMDALTAETDLTTGLRHNASGLLGMTAAHPGAVAVCYGGEWTCSGNVPPPEAREAIVTRLAKNFPDQLVFATDSLSSHFPGTQPYEDIASGLIAMSLTRSARDYVLWFRPEDAATVTWAGAPSKAVRRT